MTSCSVSCDLISLSVIEWLQRAAGNYCEERRAKQFLTCCLWSQETQWDSSFSRDTCRGHAATCSERKAVAESLTVCPVCAGAVLNITRSYFFRSKSNRAWASGHGLLPKNTATERLNNIRNSLSNWSRIHMWTNPRVFTVGGESWEFDCFKWWRSHFRDQCGDMDGAQFCFLSCSPRCWCGGLRFLRARYLQIEFMVVMVAISATLTDLILIFTPSPCA